MSESKGQSSSSALSQFEDPFPEKSDVVINDEFVESQKKKTVRDGSQFNLVGFVTHKNGGLHLVDKVSIDAQKGVLKDMMKKVGSNLLKMKSLISISFPVRIFHSESVLQLISKAWQFAPIYLTRASLSKCPVERMRNVITFMIAGLHRGFSCWKPFNPILGETFQAHYTDGTRIFMEQTSHHPPVSSFQVMGPQNKWMMHGYHEFTASIRPNHVTGLQIGPNKVCFPDGTEITYKMPAGVLHGISWGDRVFNWEGTISFIDAKNGLQADVTFRPDKPGMLSFFKTEKTFIDHVRGVIFRTGTGGKKLKAPVPLRPFDLKKARVTKDDYTTKSGYGEVVSHLEGSWVHGICFDGKPYWKMLQLMHFHPQLPDRLLPTDARYRLDSVLLQQQRSANSKDFKEAQAAKEDMENLQRAEKKLRKQGKEGRKKRIKKKDFAPI